jgi:predicted metal-dependent hydrolase
MSEPLRIANLLFEVRRSPRRKALGLTVDRNGDLVIHAPTEADESELLRWTRGKLLWVHRKLATKASVAKAGSGLEFVSGETFFYLGRSYRLQVKEQHGEALRREGRVFYLRPDARTRAAEHFKRWYIDTGSEWMDRRVSFLSPRVGAVAARVNLGDLGHRWGSCGRNDTVYFNWRLLQLPVRFVDYVVAHELVHLRERHHGREFWRTLERALPDAQARKEQLRVEGPGFLRFDVVTVHDAVAP